MELVAAKVFFVVDLQPSGKLSLVQTREGRLIIMLDGQPVPGQQWKAEEVEQAVDGFRRATSALRESPRRQPA
jgi:hypothetical protein